MYLSLKSWNGIKKKRKCGDDDDVQEEAEKKEPDEEAPTSAEDDKGVPEGPIETSEDAAGNESKKATDVFSSF